MCTGWVDSKELSVYWLCGFMGLIMYWLGGSKGVKCVLVGWNQGG